MNNFSKFNRKPLDYRKPAELFEVLEKNEEPNEDYGVTTVPVKVKNVWISLSSEYRADKKSAVAELVDPEGVAVNLPPHMIPQVEEVLKDGESLSLIARGRVGLSFYEYSNKFGTQTGCFWVDL